ncbi:MAG: mechanosensitive ion channel family protein [Myxococcota bacterium]
MSALLWIGLALAQDAGTPHPEPAPVPAAPAPVPASPAPHADPAPHEPAPVAPAPEPTAPAPHGTEDPAPHGTEPDAHEPHAHEPDAHGPDAHGPDGTAPAPEPVPHGSEPAPAPVPAAPAPQPVQPQAPELGPSLPAPSSGSDSFFGFFPDPPAPEPRVVVVNQQGEPVPGLLDPILPQPPRQGLRSAIALGILAGMCALLAALFRLASRDLRSSGLLPQGLRTAEIVFRLLVALFGLGALGALVPRSLAPALPVVAIAAAVAMGWSARDVLQDLVAGVFIGVEGQLRAGHWVRGERYAGTVEAIGMRVTWLRDVYGRRIVVPNRVLLAQPLVTDENPWPRIQFTVAMPAGASTAAVRAALEEAIVVSPWVAPDPDVEVHPDGIQAGHWHVAVRLLDGRYADRFQGLLRERVEEILAS